MFREIISTLHQMHRSLSMRIFGTRRRIKKKKARKYYHFENIFQIIVIEFYFTDEMSLEF